MRAALPPTSLPPAHQLLQCFSFLLCPFGVLFAKSGRGGGQDGACREGGVVVVAAKSVFVSICEHRATAKI